MCPSYSLFLFFNQLSERRLKKKRVIQAHNNALSFING